MSFSLLQTLAGLALLVVFALLAVLVIDHHWVMYRNKYHMDDWREEMRELRSNHPDYVHEQLMQPESKTVRLIELLSAQDEDEDINITLHVVSLLDPHRQPYEAVSYCWGDLTDPLPILCAEDSLL
jgi:hypothetical protein